MKIIDEIFDDISFKIGPEKNIRKEYLYRIIKRFYKLAGLEKKFIFKNLIIPNDKLDHELKNALLNIKAMASYANGYIINRICKNLKDDQIYVNIGVWKGFSLIAGMVNTNCHVDGIDNFSEFKETNPKEEFLTNFNKYKNTRLKSGRADEKFWQTAPQDSIWETASETKCVADWLPNQGWMGLCRGAYAAG